MSVRSEYEDKVDDYFSGSYTVTDARVVPSASDVKFGKFGKKMELAMMFVDIRESTKIVDGFHRVTAARMYKSFLWGVTKIVKRNGGEVKSFNGDGLLAVFSGDSKCTNAAIASYEISWFGLKVIRPKMKKYFENNGKLKDMEFNFGVGVDLGDILIVRAGIKGEDNSDLVWAGNATNLSVKLSNLPADTYHLRVTNRVFNKINAKYKKYLDGETDIWEKVYWTDMNDAIIYRSSYWRAP